MSAICRTEQQVRDTSMSKNTVPCLARRTFFFLSPHSGSWRSEHRSAQGKTNTVCKEFQRSAFTCAAKLSRTTACWELLQGWTQLWRQEMARQGWSPCMGKVGATLPVPGTGRGHLLFCHFRIVNYPLDFIISS